MVDGRHEIALVVALVLLTVGLLRVGHHVRVRAEYEVNGQTTELTNPPLIPTRLVLAEAPNFTTHFVNLSNVTVDTTYENPVNNDIVNAEIDWEAVDPRFSDWKLRLNSSLYDSDVLQAEILWRTGKGYLWMQHSRKAGGTTLCMTLRANLEGLVRIGAVAKAPPRKTCQIASLRYDSDFVTDPKRPGVDKFIWDHMKLDNVVEHEGGPSPGDITVNEAWRPWVFVTTMRDPLKRVLSLTTGSWGCKFDYQPSFGFDLTHLSSMVWKCDKNQYCCISDYFTRQFAGVGTPTTLTSTHLELAKTNMRRYSCILLVEHWDETAHCLGSALSLVR